MMGFVRTRYGWVHKSRIHVVPYGYSVHFDEWTTRYVFKHIITGEVLVPEIDHGSPLISGISPTAESPNNRNFLIADLFASSISNAPFGTLTSTWQCANSPISPRLNTFTANWIGLEDSGFTVVFQPVTSWNNDGHNGLGTNNFTAYSEYASTSILAVSQATLISPGTTVTGQLRNLGGGNYSSQILGIGASFLQISNPFNMNLVQSAVFEFGPGDQGFSCNDYPNQASTIFSNIQYRDSAGGSGSTNWFPIKEFDIGGSAGSCGEQIQVFNSNTVVLSYRGGGLLTMGANNSTISCFAGQSTFVNLSSLNPNEFVNNSTITSNPSNGQAFTNGNELFYTPNSTFSGTDSLQYTVTNVTTSSPATITFIVTFPPPVPNLVTILAISDVPSSENVTLDNPGIQITNVAVDNSQANGKVTVEGTVITYTSNPGFVGQDFFFYTVTDQHNLTGFAQVEVTVVAPIITAAPFTMTTTSGSVVSQDVVSLNTGETIVSATIVQGAANGTAVPFGTILSYVSNANFVGTDSFTYRVFNQDKFFSDPATVTVTVTTGVIIPPPPPPPIPTAANITITVTTGTATIIDIGAANVNEPITDLTISTVPANGSATVSIPSIIYTSNANFVGIDSLQYVITNTAGNSLPATIAINVSATSSGGGSGGGAGGGQPNTGIVFVAPGTAKTRVLIPDAPPQYDEAWMDNLLSILRIMFGQPTRGNSQQQPWNVPLAQPLYSFDAATATEAETMQFLATVFNELYLRGLIS